MKTIDKISRKFTQSIVHAGRPRRIPAKKIKTADSALLIVSVLAMFCSGSKGLLGPFAYSAVMTGSMQRARTPYFQNRTET